MASLGSLIRAARTAAHWTQEDLAGRMGVSATLVSHWEKDRKPVLDLAGLARVLGLPEDQMRAADTLPAPARGGTRKANPLPADLPTAEPGGPDRYVNLATLLRWIRFELGLVYTAAHIYRWLADPDLQPPFPAYQNRLKKTPQGEPALLFRIGEVRPWLQAQIRPVKVG